jgi:uncharacterized protein with HEPN domain
MSRDEATLLDIARAAQLIGLFLHDTTRDVFLSDLKTQSAVLHQLMIIGEAVKRLSHPFRDQLPAIPWSLIAGMRDRLIHGYDSVDLDQVWITATHDVPDLLSKITPYLPQRPPPPAA